MAEHLFAGFLEDPQEYARARQYWNSVWEAVTPVNRERFGWETPWFENPFLDGNPIFTAVSSTERKGLRIIQFAPSRDHLDFQMWLDTFGGPISDPQSIAELVISCALSEETARRARNSIERWISGDLVIEPDQRGILTF